MATGSNSSSRRTGKTAALALTLALGTVGIMALTSTDSLVERGFVAALQRPVAVATQQVARASVPVAGSEDFWLSAANIPAIGPREVSLASWTAPVKLGASVTLTIAGEQRALEVIDIAEVPASVTRVDTSSGAAHLVMVSLREQGKPDGAVIRFVVETGIKGQPRIALAPRAL